VPSRATSQKPGFEARNRASTHLTFTEFDMRVAALLAGLVLVAACGCGVGTTRTTATGSGEPKTPPPPAAKQPKEEPIEKVAPMPREVKR
jgi:hypothetical protein